MVKGPGTSGKKSTKAVTTSSKVVQRVGARFYQPRPLMIIALMAVVGLLIPVTLRQLPQLSDRPEYQVGWDQIIISPAPRWIPPDLTKQVFERAELNDSEYLQDPTLSERIAAAFHTHPWIERVISVRKSYPAKICVEVVYREPVAMVKGIDGYYPIDRKSILLPARDFAASDIERFPVIERVASVPIGELGEPWGDPAVTGAAELAAVLIGQRDGDLSWWDELGLKSIQVPRIVSLAEDPDELQYQFRTAGGSEILWGRRPGSRHPGELTVAQKLQRLREFRTAYGGFDDQHGPWQIDIRPWQGIQRGVLARESENSELRSAAREDHHREPK